MEVTYGDWRLPAMMQTVPAPVSDASGGPGSAGYTINDPAALYTPHRLYFASAAEPGITINGYNGNFFWRTAHTFRGNYAWNFPIFNRTALAHFAYDNGPLILNPGSFLQGLNSASATNNSEAGLIYDSPSTNNASTAIKLLEHLRMAGGNWGTYPESGSTADFAGAINAGAASFTNVWNTGGDFDDPAGNFAPSGPYINKSDEGCMGENAYFNWDLQWLSLGRSRFSPNLMVPSSGILGSLPVGFDPAHPSITNAWRTLLFCPNPNSPTHSSQGQMPPDYMVMDLFRMPVVQPYPIGDALSTAGRVNLNYQITPFTYIHRDSALRGVLKSVNIVAVRDDDADVYKSTSTGNFPSQFSMATNYYAYRFPVHLNQTLQQFDAKFATNGFFRSGAEICSMWLYPAVAPGDTAVQQTNPATALVTDVSGSSTSISNWWYANPGTARKGMTSDNARERPYAGIYANVTTKSNVYQVHYRVQTLKQSTVLHSSGDYTTWKDPAATGLTDKVVGELLGSAMIERFIDPTDPTIPDIAGSISSGGTNAVLSPTNSLDPYYRYRVFNARLFTP